MRLPLLWIIVAAAVGLGLVLLGGNLLLHPDLPLVTAAGFDDELITPNADGVDDVTTFRYSLTRNADVSLVLIGADGQEYIFREPQPLFAQDYQVLFSGVVDGYVNVGEVTGGVVERRLIPNGDYTWRLIAEDAVTGELQTLSGPINIRDADTPLPDIETFTISPSVFTPNQDGRDDRVEINVYVSKPGASVRAFLVGENGQEIPISARKEGNINEDAQRIIFDYEGGVDLNADPPPDGTYRVVVLAQDEEGQRVRAESELTILQGGKPFAEIVPQAVGVDVVFVSRPYDERYYSGNGEVGALIAPPDDPDNFAFQAITMPVGDMLVFMLTVENYSDVPLRTTGPPPGTVYQQDQTPAAMNAMESSGAWRVGIQCETSETSFPYRWSLGNEDVLINETAADGEVFKYLPPNSRSVVWGAVRLTEINPLQNPQTCWAGLIHEDVAISERNSRVGPRDVQLVQP